MRHALSWCLAVGLCASILAALFVGESSAQGLASGGLKSIALPSTISGDKTFSGTLSLSSGTLALTATGTNLLTSATSAASASSSVGTFTFAPTATLDANDDIINVLAVAAGSSVFEMDLEGDSVQTGTVQANAFQASGSGGTFQAVASNSPVTFSGNATNGASAIGVRIANGNTLSTAGARIANFYPNNTAGAFTAGVDINGFYLQPVQADTTGSTLTLTPTSSNIELNPSSAVVVTMGETGVQDGTVVQITNIHASNAATFADTAGVTELKGPFTMNQYDSLTLRYVSDRWVETERSINNGGEIRGVLSADVTVNVNATYVNVFSVTPPASKNVTLFFRLMYVPTANTIGEQITVESADAANGNCAFTTYGISGTAASATVNEYDILAIQSSGTSTDTAAAAACNTTACPLEVLCTFISDASPQAVILKAQLETGTSDAPIKAGSFYTMTTN